MKAKGGGTLKGGKGLVISWVTVCLLVCCNNVRSGNGSGGPEGVGDNQSGRAPGEEEKIFSDLRQNMVENQIVRRGVSDPAVLKALKKVPRHRFVPDRYRMMAYNDSPLPIGESQTISQPYIVAYMTEALSLQKTDRVLEIGTGSGYQAAVLAEMVRRVYTMEIICPLAEEAKRNLASAGYNNIKVRCGDGYRGWPEQAPFDAIIVTAAPERIPETLKEQLAIGGKMIIPVGKILSFQELVLVTREGERDWSERPLLPVRFVPMTGGEGKEGE